MVFGPKTRNLGESRRPREKFLKRVSDCVSDMSQVGEQLHKKNEGKVELQVN